MNHAEKKRQRRKRKKAERRRQKRLDNAEAINERLGHLRTILYEEPSRAVWQRMCDHIEAWPDDGTLEMGLDYAMSHLEAWPDAFRDTVGAAQGWLLRRLQGVREPRLVLARVALLKGRQALEGHFEALLSGELAEHFTGFRLHAPEASDVLVRCLCARSWPHVTLLDIGRNQLQRAQTMAIMSTGRWPALTSLHLEEASLTDDDVHVLSRGGVLDRVVELNLARNALGSHALECLAAAGCAPRLRRLDLRGLSHVTADRFGHLMETLAQVEHLDLSWNFLKDATMEALVEAPLRRLKHLNLSHASLDGDELQRLLSRPWARLEVLDLSFNVLATAALQALASSPELPALRRLYLDGNPFEVGATLSAFERRRPRLEELRLLALDLRDMSLTPEELAAFLVAPGVSARLRAVVINKLERRGQRAIRLALRALTAEPPGSRPWSPDVRRWASLRLDLMTISELRGALAAHGERLPSRSHKALYIEALRAAIGATLETFP